MILREPWRGELVLELARRAPATPLLLTGPLGAGKTTVLHALANDAVFLDLFGAASTAERFVRCAADALRRFDPGAAAELSAAADGGRGAGADGVRRVFDAWQRLRVPLVLDEPTEIRSLAYFGGLREVATAFGEALQSRNAPTILATSYGFQSGRLWPAWEQRALAPLAGDDDLLRVTFGWPRYVGLLAGARDLRAAWIESMSPGGALESACRSTHEILLLRSRGYGITKALLAIVAERQPLSMTEAVAALGRTTGAVRDYLEWLRLVDAVRVDRRRYAFHDGLLRLWVLLHAQGAPPTRTRVEETYELALRSEVAAPAPPAGPLPPRRRVDTLVEID